MSGSASLICFRTVRPSRVGQPVVEQHQIDAFAMPLERLGGRLGLDDAIAFLVRAASSATSESAARRRRRESWVSASRVSIRGRAEHTAALRRFCPRRSAGSLKRPPRPRLISASACVTADEPSGISARTRELRARDPPCRGLRTAWQRPDRRRCAVRRQTSPAWRTPSS